MFWSHPSLFEPPAIEPWEPRALAHDEWADRDYRGVYAWRIAQLEAFEEQPVLLQAAKAYYADKPAEFIMHWCDTYDPRKKDTKWIPFVFFKKQEEFIRYLHELVSDDENGLIEKCRDVGATWLCVGYSVWAWLFVKDVSIGWGSRKQELVDRIGEPDSIFEKLRLMIDRLPKCFMPNGFNPASHATFMKILNPSNGSTISGESGDNIGRGGRKSMYFKDESAHYERPEKIEAALGDNTNVQIDISSVNGLGNVFERRRNAGVDWPEKIPGRTRVFVFDYSDHPEKTEEWYNKRKARYESEGLGHVFAQEVDRNYSAAISNTIIPMIWIIAARDAHLKIKGMLDGPYHGGFDVADEGADTNAIADIKGVVLRNSEEWGSRDPGVSARRAIEYFKKYPNCTVFYDNIAVGSNVKSEINRLGDDGIDIGVDFIGWNAGAAVQNPYDHVIIDDDESPLNKDFFYNMKAQAWWSLRTRFLRTYQYIVQGINHPVDQLISLSTKNPLIRKLEKELAQPTMIHNGRLQMIIDKKPDGTKSPNLADAAVMGYFPIEDVNSTPVIGKYGNG